MLVLRLWYSNQLEELVGALVANEQALREAGATDPFDPITVIVPNRNIATYLKFEVARRRGILANVRFEYLHRFFRNAIVDDDVQILAREDIHTLLLDLLHDDDLMDDPELESVRGYLAYAGEPDGRARRIWQLGHELSRVFEEYTLSRPRMLDLWPSKRVIKEEPYASTEQWQRRLWLELFGDGGRVAATAARVGKRLVLMPDVFGRNAANVDLPGHIHVFGLSYVARSFYKLLDQLSARCELLVYTMNPCMEYWEDVPSGWNVGHARAWTRRGAEQAQLFVDDGVGPVDDSPPALRAWGSPGRNNIRMLNMLTQCDFASAFADPVAAGDTMLHRLQHDIMVRQPTALRPDRKYDDDSITVLGCANPQREVEVVADEILCLMSDYAARGEPLAFHDIAVIVNEAEREAYQSRIRSVFSAMGEIPHNIIDIRATAHRRYLEAVELLLGLPFGRFTRRELLRLMTHDNVLATQDGVDAATWERWCNELNILHGADEADHEGTYIHGPLYHWEQGLRRLTLGAFMSNELAGDTRVFEQDDVSYLPYEIAASDVETAAQFVALARNLIRDARGLLQTRKPLSAWLDEIGQLIARYLQPVDDDDEVDRLRVARFLRELSARDLSQADVHFRVAYEFVAANLASLEISRGQYLSEGVVVSSFLPMRPIPFKVVFVTGLGERQFPRSDVRSPLDLRWSSELKGAQGDVISARAQDEYMFLETLLSTRDRFYMSFVSRDSHTGKDLEPSSVVRLLWFMLEQSYMTPQRLKERWIPHPLRRWDDAYFEGELRTYQPDAHREANIHAVRTSLEAFCEQRNLLIPNREELLPALDASKRDELLLRLGLVAVNREDANRGDGTVPVRLRQILKFLESPTQGTAEFYLGMTDDDAFDMYTVEDEVFETDLQHRAILLRRAFVTALLEHDGTPTDAAMRDHYAAMYAREQLRGSVPTGMFGRVDLSRQLAILQLWLANHRQLKLDGPPTVVSFGSSLGAAVSSPHREPALHIDVGDFDASIEGSTALVWPAQGCSVVLGAGSVKTAPGPQEAGFLRGFLDQAVLAAAGVAPQRRWRVVLNMAEPLDRAKHCRIYGEFTTDAATAWLRDVLTSMIAPSGTWFLPAEAVFEHYYGRGRPIGRSLDDARDGWGWYSYKSGPLHRPQEQFPNPPDPQAVIAHRFGAYFSRRRDPPQ